MQGARRLIRWSVRVPQILTKVWKVKNATQFPEERREIKWRGANPLHL